MNNKLLQRVDIQVTILVVVIVAFSVFFVFSLVYSMSYKEMLNMLEEDVNSLASHIEKNLNNEIFLEITDKDDMQQESYIKAQAFLDRIRSVSKVKYLYTAITNTKKELIYHVDGLPYDDPDFRNVGDLIESDFTEPLLKALQGTTVMPDDILKTEWGIVYIAYYPLHDKSGDVVAALGIEFPAERQYIAYRNIRIIINFVIAILCLLAGIVARSLFQRISNPHFRDIYNTDSLTKLKNRSAFDTDINNYIHRQRLDGVVLVITDLNGLKPINDTFGHKMGDFYIESCAKALVATNMQNNVVYRIGGDEFVTLIPAENYNMVDMYIQSVKENVHILCSKKIANASVAMGYAVCKGTDLTSWEKAQKAADEAMYKDKRTYYEKNKSLNTRRS